NVAELHNVQGHMRGYGAASSAGQIARQSATSSQGRGRASGNPATINVEPPSNAMKTYVNPTRLYSIAVPSNWQVYQQGNSGVTFAPQGGIGNINGQTEVVYGAIVNHYDPFGNAQGGYEGNISVQNATEDLLATVERSSPYLRVVNGSRKQLRLNGGTALAAELRGVDPKTGVDERITVVTRQLSDEHLVYVLFVTPE